MTYVIAIGAVALATLLRFVLQAELPHGLPITTYSLALIVAVIPPWKQRLPGPKLDRKMLERGSVAQRVAIEARSLPL